MMLDEGMTLDETIKRFSDNAEYERTHGSPQGCLAFRQLAEWITELKELKEQAEHCEDCISRSELLKAIDTWDKFGFEHTGCFVREPKDDFVTYVHYDDVVKCIKGMPSVQPERKWVPVNERLPNFNDIVLASADSNYDELRVIITVYSAEEFWFNGKIKAWMPLPKPYKAESEEV